MNRRHVFELAGGVALAPALGALALSGCGSSATPVAVAPRVATMSLTTAGFLEEFAGVVNARVVSTDVKQWLDAAITSVRTDMAMTRRKMEEHGFTNYPISKVFASEDVTVYGVGNVDGLNFCAPFLVNGQPAVLAEGPALTGLHFASKDWPKTGTVSLLEGLLPLAKYHDFGSQYDASLDSPLHYGTKVGDLFITYRSDQATGTGVVRVISILAGAASALFDRQYTVTWGA